MTSSENTAPARWPQREHTSTTLREAMATVGRAGSSSSLLAISTVHRLVRTMSAWIQTLEARRRQLSDEIDARARELEDLERQIAQERKNAEGVAIAARGWASEIEHQVLARKAELQAEAEALEAQLRAISSSLEDLPSPRSLETPKESGQASDPAKLSDGDRGQDSSEAESRPLDGESGSDPLRKTGADVGSRQ